ncbi:MAG: hypothetical protein NT045_08650 [Candidatus Aureabacteria bacterium]|nr:hypothetical protein [Candidatus Auribacterota bacterium]
MALKPKDRVEWRAGNSASTTHLRQGVVQDLLPGGICLVKTKVSGETEFEEIRAARLRKVEEPKKTAAPKKKTSRKTARAKKKAARAEK